MTPTDPTPTTYRYLITVDRIPALSPPPLVEQLPAILAAEFGRPSDTWTVEEVEW